MNFFIEIALYSMIGLISGFFGGLLGIGGGLITVPALLLTFQHADHAMHLAVGTSLAAMIFTSLSSATAHSLKKGVRWPIFRVISFGIIIGASLGGFIADHFSSERLAFFFGSFAIGFGIYFLSPRGNIERETRAFVTSKVMVLPGICIGALSALLGIGGGLMMVPFLTYCGVQIREAISTSAVTGVLIAIFGALSFLFFGLGDPSLKGTLGYIYIPAFIAVGIASCIAAPLGARLTHSLPLPLMRKIFGVFLIFVGLSMV